jgi:hypothetical protein
MAVLQEHQVVQEHQVTSSWGRSCDSIQDRFQRQQSGLAELSPGSMRSVFASVSTLRTLRRANARNCSFVHDPDLDMSGLSQLAAASLRQSPCYEAANSAMAAAQDLPAEEREDSMASAMVMLLSSTCTAEPQEEPELSSPTEEEMEEDIDESTDQILDDLTTQSQSSLLQTSNGFIISADVTLIVGWILLGLALAVFCGYVMQFIWRALKWVGCAITGGGSSCYEEEAPRWLRYLLTGGSAALCLYGGAIAGGLSSLITTMYLGEIFPAVFETINFGHR